MAGGEKDRLGKADADQSEEADQVVREEARRILDSGAHGGSINSKKLAQVVREQIQEVLSGVKVKKKIVKAEVKRFLENLQGPQEAADAMDAPTVSAEQPKERNEPSNRPEPPRAGKPKVDMDRVKSEVSSILATCDLDELNLKELRRQLRQNAPSVVLPGKRGLKVVVAELLGGRDGPGEGGVLERKPAKRPKVDRDSSDHSTGNEHRMVDSGGEQMANSEEEISRPRKAKREGNSEASSDGAQPDESDDVPDSSDEEEAERQSTRHSRFVARIASSRSLNRILRTVGVDLRKKRLCDLTDEDLGSALSILGDTLREIREDGDEAAMRTLRDKFHQIIPTSGPESATNDIDGVGKKVGMVLRVKEALEADALAARFLQSHEDAFQHICRSWASLSAPRKGDFAMRVWQNNRTVDSANQYEISYTENNPRCQMNGEFQILDNKKLLYTVVPASSVVCILKHGFRRFPSQTPRLSLGNGLEFQESVKDAFERFTSKSGSVKHSNRDLFVFAAEVACGKVFQVDRATKWYKRAPPPYHSICIRGTIPRFLVFDEGQIRPIGLAPMK